MIARINDGRPGPFDWFFESVLETEHLELTMAAILAAFAGVTFVLAIFAGTTRRSVAPSVIGAVMWMLVYWYGNVSRNDQWSVLPLVGGLACFATPLLMAMTAWRFIGMQERIEKRHQSLRDVKQQETRRKRLEELSAEIVEREESIEHLKRKVQEKTRKHSNVVIDDPLNAEVREYQAIIEREAQALERMRREHAELSSNVPDECCVVLPDEFTELTDARGVETEA